MKKWHWILFLAGSAVLLLALADRLPEKAQRWGLFGTAGYALALAALGAISWPVGLIVAAFAVGGFFGLPESPFYSWIPKL